MERYWYKRRALNVQTGDCKNCTAKEGQRPDI